VGLVVRNSKLNKYFCSYNDVFQKCFENFLLTETNRKLFLLLLQLVTNAKNPVTALFRDSKAAVILTMKTYADSGLSLKTPPGLLMTHKLKWFFPAPMSHGYF
jgi:hypothetical protein